MITLNASGGSVTFTFSGNSTYLNDGTITVPVNSLALIIDESNMATFRKAASNDIFVSANVSEFGMTKDELMAWYKANMVGSTGGGGGVTSGEVQTMIDESISGKADSSDVYTTGQTSGATEIANALNAKLDATAYTPTVVDAALSQSSTNPVQNQALYGELRVGGGTSKVEIDFNTGGYVPEGVTQLEVNPTTTDSWATYNFYNGNTRLGYYNFTNWGSFNVGNSLEGSSYVISGETVIITYPASLGVTRIAQDGGNAPWSFEAIVETPAVPLKDVISGKVDTTTYTAYTASTDAALSGKADSSAVTEEINAAVSGKVDTTTYTAYTANTQTVLNSKLDATAYTPVQVSSAITENDTNAVAGGAVYDKVHVTSGEGSTTLLTFGSETIPETGFISAATNYQSGVTKFNIELDLTQWGRWSPTLGFYDSNNNIYAGQIINTDGVITYADRSNEMFGTSMSATTSYTNNVFTIEVTGLSGDAPSGLTMFGLGNMEPVVNAYAIEGESVEYWIKDYVDAKVAEAGDEKVDTNTYTAYTAATDAALSGKADTATTYTKTEVDNAITAATATKQDTLVSGTNIKTINNESILGSGNIVIQGGGSSLPISAGTGSNSIIVGSYFNEASGSYSVAQGEWTKASGGTSHTEGNRTKTYGSYSHAEGSYSEASGGYSHAEGDSTYATAQASHSEGQGTSATSMSSHSEGRYTQANGMGSHSEGYYTIAENNYEHASGKFNASNTGESTSAQTLFSVGNGGWDETLQENVRHNAFEIRQNGDIYFEYDGADTKLQDKLDEIESVTAAALNNLNDRIAALEAIIQNMNN